MGFIVYKLFIAVDSGWVTKQFDAIWEEGFVTREYSILWVSGGITRLHMVQRVLLIIVGKLQASYMLFCWRPF